MLYSTTVCLSLHGPVIFHHPVLYATLNGDVLTDRPTNLLQFFLRHLPIRHSQVAHCVMTDLITTRKLTESCHE